MSHASRASYGTPDWEVEGWVTTYAAIEAGEIEVVSEWTGHAQMRSRVSAPAPGELQAYPYVLISRGEPLVIESSGKSVLIRDMRLPIARTR